MIATPPRIRAAVAGAKGAAVLAATLLLVDGALAQQQSEPPAQQFGPRVSQGQAARPQAPQPDIVSTHGDWTVQCQENPAGADAASGGGVAGERACGMIQSAQHAERQNVGLTLVVVKAVQEGEEVTMMRVMAPIGVYLPTGIALEVDGEAVGRVPFTRCLPQTCIAFAEASPPTLDKLKKGGIANFIIYEAPGLGMSMELSLIGFTAALNKLDEL